MHSVIIVVILSNVIINITIIVIIAVR